MALVDAYICGRVGSGCRETLTIGQCLPQQFRKRVLAPFLSLHATMENIHATALGAICRRSLWKARSQLGQQIDPSHPTAAARATAADGDTCDFGSMAHARPSPPGSLCLQARIRFAPAAAGARSPPQRSVVRQMSLEARMPIAAADLRLNSSRPESPRTSLATLFGRGCSNPGNGKCQTTV
jgi:hypothetical protein